MFIKIIQMFYYYFFILCYNTAMYSVLIPTLFLLIVLVFISFLYKDAKRNTHDNNQELPYFTEIETSMGYIRNSILESGRFIYRKNVDPEVKYDNEVYNSLRHAGTLYAMYMYEKLGLESKYRDERLVSSKYFVEKYVKQLDNGNYAVITIPEEEGIKYTIAKTGASGVALCSLCNLYEDKELELSILRGIGEFLISMISDEGDVYAFYNLDDNTINKEAQAIYYPAEAAAGLLALYEIDPQQKWLDAVKKILLYIAKTRKTLELEIPFDHWSVFAIEKLISRKLLNEEEKIELVEYAQQMIIPVLSDQITNPKHSYCGAFKENIRPCSIGTIMEGLASVYFITENTQLRTIIYKALTIGCHFLSKVQVKTGENAGGLPNSANWVVAGVTPNASIIRIDNVQHVVLAWLRFQQIIKFTGNY